MSDGAVGRQDCLVGAGASWEAQVSGEHWSEDGPKSLDINVLEEGLSQLVVVIVSDHGLEELHAFMLKKLKDVRVFINLFLGNGARARTESWVEQQDDSCYLGIIETSKVEALFEEYSDSEEPFLLIPVVATLEEVMLLLE